MSEIKSADINHDEVNKSKYELSYKDIKPQTHINIKEANAFINSLFEGDSNYNNLESIEKLGLSEEEVARIKEETRWSDEIISHINSWEQYEIYRDAELHEEEINGRKCLLKDIDLDYVDEKTGLTNKELMIKGRSPIDWKTGEKIELHHMGQAFDSPFVELTENSEHGGKNHKILHDNSIESFRRDPELKNQYQNHDKPQHWKSRAREGVN